MSDIAWLDIHSTGEMAFITFNRQTRTVNFPFRLRFVGTSVVRRFKVQGTFTCIYNPKGLTSKRAGQGRAH